MSFINGLIPGSENDRALRGSASPKTKIVRELLMVRRPPGMVMPNNAPARNYRAGVPSFTVQTPIQKIYVAQLRDTKINGLKAGRESWIGKQFGA